MFALSFAIARPLQDYVRVVKALAAGDLTRPIPSGGCDETGQLLKAMGDVQKGSSNVVSSLQQHARQLAQTATLARELQTLSMALDESAARFRTT